MKYTFNNIKLFANNKNTTFFCDPNALIAKEIIPYVIHNFV